MNHCLVCGAKSWGPALPGTYVSGRIDGDTFQIQLTDADRGNWRQCDSCHTLASAALIEQDPISGPKPDAEFSSPFDAIMRGVSEGLKGSPGPDYGAMMEMFASRMPEPETRVERIVKSLIHAGALDANGDNSSNTWAPWVVNIARKIEFAMDKPNPLTPSILTNPLGAVPDAPWATLTWRIREQFVSWCADTLDKTRPDFGQGWNSDAWAESIADLIEGKRS